MTDLLLDLPAQLSLHLLGTWVGVSGIGMLDLAYNNKEKRATLLDMFQSKELVITDTTAYSDDYNVFFLSWCQLRKLRFSFFVLGYTTTELVKQDVLSMFVKMNGPTLKTLGVHADSARTKGVVLWWKEIAAQCFFLEEFELDVVGGLDDGSVFATILRRNCPTLRKVDIKIDGFQADLPTDCAFPHLGEFHARDEVTVAGVEQWVVNCPNLRRFAIDVRKHNMPQLLQNIAQHCKSINSINLLQVGDDSVGGIIRHCPEGPALHLLFEGRSTETTMVNCFLRLKNIQSVSFVNNSQFNDGCLEAMRQFCASSLRKLSINRCEEVTFGALHALVKECKMLRILYLKNGPVLSPKQLSTLVRACPTITRLSLIAPYRANDTVLTSIATRCKELTYLNIESGLTCHPYTMKGLKALLQGCSQLTTLCLGNAYKKVFTNESSAELKARYPNVSIEKDVSPGYKGDDSDEIQ